MSSPFSRKMQGVATRLLTKFGSTVILVRAGLKVWDGSAGEYIRGPDTRVPLVSVPVPVKVELINDTTIQAGDMIVRADFSVKPSHEDKVEFDGAVWSVVNIEPKFVNDDVVVWFIQVRK